MPIEQCKNNKWQKVWRCTVYMDHWYSWELTYTLLTISRNLYILNCKMWKVNTVRILKTLNPYIRIYICIYILKYINTNICIFLKESKATKWTFLISYTDHSQNQFMHDIVLKIITKLTSPTSIAHSLCVLASAICVSLSLNLNNII
jgi:hypothetical protein